MDISIIGTDTIRSLEIIDPDSGEGYIRDFIGVENMSAFDYDEDTGLYTCDEDTYEWWSAVANAHQKMKFRLHTLKKLHGSEKIDEVLHDLPWYDLDEYPWVVQEYLDNAFGEES